MNPVSAGRATRSAGAKSPRSPTKANGLARPTGGARPTAAKRVEGLPERVVPPAALWTVPQRGGLSQPRGDERGASC
jgi:hypothetical protein